MKRPPEHQWVPHLVVIGVSGIILAVLLNNSALIVLSVPNIFLGAPTSDQRRLLWGSIAFSILIALNFALIVVRDAVTEARLVSMAMVSIFPIAGFIAYALQRRKTSEPPSSP